MSRISVVWRITVVLALALSGISSFMLYLDTRAGYNLLTGVCMLITATLLALYFFAEYKHRSQQKALIDAQYETIRSLREHIVHLEKRLHQTIGNRDREHDL